MTREEAIRIIDLRSTCRECVVSEFDCDDCDIAFVMAIEALKQPELVRCKDCRFAHRTYDGACKQCEQIKDDDDVMLTVYFPGDHYCAYGERRTDT